METRKKKKGKSVNKNISCYCISPSIISARTVSMVSYLKYLSLRIYVCVNNMCHGIN